MTLRTTLLPAILTLMCASAAFAALGGDAASIQSDQARMRAQRQVSQSARYVVHEMKAETGTTVREFVSPEGKVFGVSWSGPVHPNMQQLLGAYYEEFQHYVPAHRVHGPLVIHTGNIVLESGGHQRALTGRAYIPAMVPQGVSLEEIH